MRIRSSLAVTAAIALAIVEGSAQAQAPPPRPRANPVELFAQLDANGDQAIDRGEVPEAGHDAFETLLEHGDVNRDGRLEGEELRALLERLRSFAPVPNPTDAARFFRGRDRNRDGALDRGEFPGPPPLFDRLDADGDGKLSADELRRARESAGRGPRPGQAPEPPSPNQGEGGRVDP